MKKLLLSIILLSLLLSGCFTVLFKGERVEKAHITKTYTPAGMQISVGFEGNDSVKNIEKLYNMLSEEPKKEKKLESY